MIDGLRIYDSFVPDLAALRAHASTCHFADWKGHDGQVYKRVWLGEVPGVRAAIEKCVGPVEMFGMGYRLNLAGELPNVLVHSDLGWGTHALVLYLTPPPEAEEGPHGTAFWHHVVTGSNKVTTADIDLLATVCADWDRLDAWSLRGVAEMKPNRGIIYDGSLYHSRYPFAAFGDSIVDGRLVAVAFFTPHDKDKAP